MIQVSQTGRGDGKDKTQGRDSTGRINIMATWPVVTSTLNKYPVLDCKTSCTVCSAQTLWTPCCSSAPLSRAGTQWLVLPISFIQAEAGRGSKTSFQHASQIHMLKQRAKLKSTASPEHLPCPHLRLLSVALVLKKVSIRDVLKHNSKTQQTYITVHQRWYYCSTWGEQSNTWIYNEKILTAAQII